MHHRILVIEDTKPACDQLRRMLERTYDCTVICQSTLKAGHEEFINVNGFTAVVCDAGLPDSEPRLTCRTAPGLFAPLPVIMMSAITDPVLIDLAMDNGAEAFIIKDGTTDRTIAEKVGLSMRKRVSDPRLSRDIMRNRTSRANRVSDWFRRNAVAFFSLLLSLILAGSSAGANWYRATTGKIRNAADVENALLKNDEKFMAMNGRVNMIEQRQREHDQQVDSKLAEIANNVSELNSKAAVSISERGANGRAIEELRRHTDDRFDHLNEQLLGWMKELRVPPGR